MNNFAYTRRDVSNYLPGPNTLGRDYIYPPRAPPGILPHREYSRYDYFHDRNPALVPHVREYEHGREIFRGIPVFNPNVPPPPFVLNAASENPLLLESLRQRSEASRSLNQSTHFILILEMI